MTVSACSRQEFITKSRFASNIRIHLDTGERADLGTYSEELYGKDADKQIEELPSTDGDTIRVCASQLCVAHRLTADLLQSCAQKAQHHAGKGEAVLYAIAGRADLECIMFCSKKRAARNLNNEMLLMKKHHKTNLEGYVHKAKLSSDEDLLQC